MKIGQFGVLLAVGSGACAPAEVPIVVVNALPASTMSLPPSASSLPPGPTSVATEAPFAPGQTWIGRYYCAQGETALLFRVERVDGHELEAIFDFRHGPTGVEGSYRMLGRWDQSGNVAMHPGEWLDRPPRYVTVGMTGRVTGTQFTGTIDNPSCRDFSVALDESE